MFCKNCGSKLEEGKLYCSNCGQKVEQEESKKEVVEPITNIESNTNSNNNEANGVSNDKGDNAPIILGILSIIFAGLFIISLPLSIIGLVIYSKSKKSNQNPSIAGKILNIIGLILSIVAIVCTSLIIGFSVYAVKNYSNNDNNNEVVEDEYKQVGKDYYGYINVPKDWVVFYDTTDSNHELYQYSDANKDEILTMNVYKNVSLSLDDVINNLQSYLNTDKAENISVTSAYVDYYDAKKISCYDQDKYLTIWVFQDDEQGYIHYVALESTNKNSDIFNLIGTYKLED